MCQLRLVTFSGGWQVDGVTGGMGMARVCSNRTRPEDKFIRRAAKPLTKEPSR